jgi:guanylate kinase
MNRLISVSGAAGVGKDTIIDAAMPRLREMGIEWAPSISTRDPRPDDRPGVMIHVSKDEFLTRLQSGDMMEHTQVTGNLYGTPSDSLDAGRVGAVKILTVDGVWSVRDWMEEMGVDVDRHLLAVYVTAPKVQVHDRLLARGWDDDEIRRRDGFNLRGYGANSIPVHDFRKWSVISNTNGSIDRSVMDLVRMVEEFLR